MTAFKNKLQNVIFEQAAPMFNNQNLYPSDVSEDDIVTDIVNRAPLCGLKYLGYDEGVASFSTYSKAAIEQFASFLDENDYVETYDISVAVTEPFTLKTNMTTDLDFDSTNESVFIEFFIDVAIDFSIISYNDSYMPGDVDETPFFYAPDEQETELRNVAFYGTDDVGFNSVNQSEAPLLLKISNEKSKSPYGSFIVTVHPKNPELILVQCNYSSEPSLDDVESDLTTLNSGDFGGKFNNEFEIVTKAKYFEGEPNTTSAIYRTTNKESAIKITESIFKTFSESLNEITRIIKVNSRGKRRIKMQCRPGFKYDETRKACVKISGAEMAHSRIAHRQMARTKKALGVGYKTKILRKVRKAKRFRKMMGL